MSEEDEVMPHLMRRTLIALAGIATLAVSATAFAGGLVEAGELEHARANARAGGPVSERDAELLDRWGCTSGTDNPYCDRQYRERRHHHKHRRYIERD